MRASLCIPALVVVLVTANAGIARADEAATATAPTIDDDSEAKSPITAVTLSLLGTAAAYGLLFWSFEVESGTLFAAGATLSLVGPSLGHLYTGENAAAGRHILVRTSGGLLMLAGLAILLDDIACYRECERDDESNAVPITLLLTGLAVQVGATLHSITDASDSARRVNAKARPRFLLAPTPLRGPNQSLGFGIQLQTRF